MGRNSQNNRFEWGVTTAAAYAPGRVCSGRRSPRGRAVLGGMEWTPPCRRAEWVCGWVTQVYGSSGCRPDADARCAGIADRTVDGPWVQQAPRGEVGDHRAPDPVSMNTLAMSGPRWATCTCGSRSDVHARVPITLTWRQLFRQFGADPEGRKAGHRFTRGGLAELKKIKRAWPTCTITRSRARSSSCPRRRASHRHSSVSSATRAFFMTLWRPCSRNDGRSCGIRWG